MITFYESRHRAGCRGNWSHWLPDKPSSHIRDALNGCDIESIVVRFEQGDAVEYRRKEF